jgi:hypothetical protein
LLTFLAPFINKCIDDLDFSEDTLFRVGVLLRALFEEAQEELDPNNVDDSNPAEMNLTYFLYVIKDVLEHTGFFGNRSKTASKMGGRDLKMATGLFEVLTRKQEYLTRVIATLEQ